MGRGRPEQTLLQTRNLNQLQQYLQAAPNLSAFSLHFIRNLLHVSSNAHAIECTYAEHEPALKSDPARAKAIRFQHFTRIELTSPKTQATSVLQRWGHS